MVLIDGVVSPDEAVDPKKHRYIGMFRFPYEKYASLGAYVACTCGQTLKHLGQNREHWQNGCFDMPQYQTIKET